jgi:23S rRNA-intervening sequence protein
MGKGLRLEDLEVYKVAMEIGEIVWKIISRWEYFEKKTLVAQYVEAADSIAMNISEGYGRFHYKENKTFVTTVVVQQKKLSLLQPKPKKEI